MVRALGGELEGRYVDGAGRVLLGLELAFGRSSTPRAMASVYRHLGRLGEGKAAYLAYLDVLEAQPRVYRYQGPGVWPERTEAEQRAKQDADLAAWLAGERDRAEGVFR